MHVAFASAQLPSSCMWCWHVLLLACTCADLACAGPSLQAPVIAYSSALKSRPLLTKACTSMVGFVLGDLIAQVRMQQQ